MCDNKLDSSINAKYLQICGKVETHNVIKWMKSRKKYLRARGWTKAVGALYYAVAAISLSNTEEDQEEDKEADWRYDAAAETVNVTAMTRMTTRWWQWGWWRCNDSNNANDDEKRTIALQESNLGGGRGTHQMLDIIRGWYNPRPAEKTAQACWKDHIFHKYHLRSVRMAQSYGSATQLLANWTVSQVTRKNQCKRKGQPKRRYSHTGPSKCLATVLLGATPVLIGVWTRGGFRVNTLLTWQKFVSFFRTASFFSMWCSLWRVMSSGLGILSTMKAEPWMMTYLRE